MLRYTWGVGEPGQPGHYRVCLPVRSIPCRYRRRRGPSAFEYGDAGHRPEGLGLRVIAFGLMVALA